MVIKGKKIRKLMKGYIQKKIGNYIVKKEIVSHYDEINDIDYYNAIYVVEEV